MGVSSGVWSCWTLNEIVFGLIGVAFRFGFLEDFLVLEASNPLFAVEGCENLLPLLDPESLSLCHRSLGDPCARPCCPNGTKLLLEGVTIMGVSSLNFPCLKGIGERFWGTRIDARSGDDISIDCSDIGEAGYCIAMESPSLDEGDSP